MKVNRVAILVAVMALSQGVLNAEVAKTETDFGYVGKFTVDEVDYQANVYTRTGTTWSLSIPDGVEEVEYLVVAGGGSGGNYATTGGGGGGAGGLLSGKIAVSGGAAFSITVGAGGAAGGNNGMDSILLLNGSALATAVGGGCGGKGRGGNGAKGGSGGGSGGMTGTGAGACESGQGNKGGQSGTTGGSGGGGAGEEGDPSTDANGANGGAGVESSISGEPLWFAAGGGGGCYVNGSTTGGEGGSGIGGNGGTRTDRIGTAGVDGTGSGGGGGSMSNDIQGGKGGDGVVILRFKAVAGATSLLGATVSLKTASVPYDAQSKTPELQSITLADGTVLTAEDLTLGTDYEIVPATVGPAAGTYILTVNGLGDYCDSAAVSFAITQAQDNALSGSFVQPDWEWGFEPARPAGSLSATFGNIVYRYYEEPDCSGEAFVPAWKTPPGTYYVRGEVDETTDYRGVVSDPVEFKVGATYKPIPRQKRETEFGFTRKMAIAGKSYCACAYTNTASEWSFVVPASVSQIEYLAVGGGGGGGGFKDTGGGGGGAGGLVTNVIPVKAGDVITVRVGAGGDTMTNGCDTVIWTNGVELVRAYGGGHGSRKMESGGSGGSGGGNGGMSDIAPGSGLEGQGHAGGFGFPTGGSGGGGAGSAGANTTSPSGADGGEGLENFISGVSQWYAGGGGGGCYHNGGIDGGRGGSGVGGNGGTRDGKVGFDGVDGTGSGGGGASMSDGTKGGRGGSGVVILRHQTNSGLVILLQ